MNVFASGSVARPSFRTVLMLMGAVLVAACSAEPREAPDDGWRGAQLAEPVERPEFTLLDTDGQPFDFRERTRGALTLLFFGYTSCPDVCPVHMANLAAVLDRYDYDVQSRVQVVFVTTDPERDTPERIRAWLDQFDPSFVGLRGGLEEVNRIQRTLGLPEAKAGGIRADGTYDVGHAATVLAFEPDGPARRLYLFGTRQADWENDLPRLLGTSR